MMTKHPNTDNQLRFFITSDAAIISSQPYRNILFPDPSTLSDEQNWLLINPEKPQTVLVVFLMNGQTPIACIGGFNRNPERFIMATWAVQRNLLNNKLGQHLLSILEKQLIKMGFSEMEINFRNDLTCQSVIKHILSKYHWVEPRIRLIQFKMNVTEAKLPAWFARFKQPRDAELFPWNQLRTEEKTSITKDLENGLTPQELSPFQLENKIAYELSFGVRRNDRLLGWIIVHRIRNDLMNYTCLWTAPECRHSGYGLLLIKSALQKQSQLGVNKLLFQVLPENQSMLACITKRLAELVTAKVPLWTSAKRIR